MPAGIGERSSDVATRGRRANPCRLGPVQAIAAAYRGRSWMHAGDLVKHPG